MSSDGYLEPYRQSVRRHGTGFEATLWASPRSQRLRFEVFWRMCDLGGQRVLDAGCSNGDFAAFLVEKGVEYGSFVGIDGVAEVIERARARGLPRAEFHAGDFLARPELLSIGEPQVVCISGTLNTMSLRQAVRVLESAWEAASSTLLFNFLTDLAGIAAPPQTGPAHRLSAIKLIRWATSRTPLVAYRQDYFNHGHDATIMMRRAPLRPIDDGMSWRT